MRMMLDLKIMFCTVLIAATATTAFHTASSKFGVAMNKDFKNSLAAGRIPSMDEPNEEPKQPPAPRRRPPLPTVDGKSGQLDVVSRLLKDRILLLGTDVNDEMANVLVAQLLYLANEDPDKDITVYINSPGGSVSAGLAIYDTMQFITPNVATICTGMAASMGAVLLCAGEKGKRSALPHSRVMIHQPMGGAQGQASDMEITLQEILKLKKELYEIIASHSGQPFDKVELDSDRDYWMTSTEAKEYGMIDEILEGKRTT